MMFNATFNNISILSWQSRKPKYPEKTTDLPQAIDKLYNMSGIQTQMLLVIDPDCIGSCKSNYLAITTMTAPGFLRICLSL